MAKLPKHYSLVAEHKGSYEIHDSRDGNRFHVAKAPLGMADHVQMSSLPKYAKGGDTPAPTETPAPSETAIPAETPVPDQTSSSGVPFYLAPQPGDNDPVPTGLPAPNGIGDQTADPTLNKNVDGQMTGGGTTSGTPSAASPLGISAQLAAAQKMQEQGIQGVSDAKETEGKDTAAAIATSNKAQQTFQDEARATQITRQAELDQQAKDAAKEIDPHSFISNMGIGNKILAGIAMALGGAGAATTGQQNLAYESIQNAIKQDVEAQKENQSNKKSLYAQNLARYNDDRLATQATLMQMNARLQGTIAGIAAKSQSAQAAAGRDLLVGKLRDENIGRNAQASVQETALNNMRSGRPMNAIDLVNAGIIPKEYQADAYKEQSSIEAQKNALAGIDNVFDKMDKEQSTGNLLNPQSSRRMDAYKTEIVNQVMNASASKRLTRESIEHEIQPLITGNLSNQDTRQVQKGVMKNLIKNHADPTPLMQKYSPASLPDYSEAPVKRQASDGNFYFFDPVTKKNLGIAK